MKFTQQEVFVISRYLRTLARVSEEQEKDHSMVNALSELADNFDLGKIDVTLSMKQRGMLYGMSKQFCEFALTQKEEDIKTENLEMHRSALHVFRNLKLSLEQ